MSAPLVRLDTVDSTNSWIKRNPGRLGEFGAVYTTSQTAGRGRLGRRGLGRGGLGQGDAGSQTKGRQAGSQQTQLHQGSPVEKQGDVAPQRPR